MNQSGNSKLIILGNVLCAALFETLEEEIG